MKLVIGSSGIETKLLNGDYCLLQISGVLSACRPRQSKIPQSPHELVFVDSMGCYHEDMRIRELKDMRPRELLEILEAFAGGKLNRKIRDNVFYLALGYVAYGKMNKNIAPIFPIVKYATGLNFRVAYKTKEYIRVKFTKK